MGVEGDRAGKDSRPQEQQRRRQLGSRGGKGDAVCRRSGRWKLESGLTRRRMELTGLPGQ